jgi:hypothetical protein
MPQSNRNNNKNKNNQNNLNNANSRNQQSTINNVQVAGNSMDDNSNDRWTVVIDSKKNDRKKNYSSTSEQNSPKIPINKNKKFFFTTNRYEILSQIDQIDPVQSSSKSQLNDTHASDFL